MIGLTLNISLADAQPDKNRTVTNDPQEIIDAKATGPAAPGSSNLSAVQVIVIYGDPSRAGLYTILLKVAANTKIPAHLHPDDRVGTVVSEHGTMDTVINLMKAN